jgi:hypothetical protein
LSKAFPQLSAIERKRFVIQPIFVELIACRRKTTTIRYRANSVEYPAADILPLVVTSANPEAPPLDLFSVRVTSVCYKALSALDEEDAVRDGFVSLSELKETLQQFYGTIGSNDVLSIFSIIPELDTHQSQKLKPKAKIC